MKNIDKKCFGIGAVFLLLLISCTSVINGMTVENNLFNTILSTGDSQDLKIEIIEKPYSLDVPFVDDNGNEYALYRVKYEIYNNKNVKFTGKPLTAILSGNGLYEIDSWYEINFNERDREIPITIGAGKSIIREYDIKVECEKNEEQYFLDEDIIIECGIAGCEDENPIDNYDKKRIWKFWSDNEEWMPTLGQLKGFGIHSDKIEITSSINGKILNFKVPQYMKNEKYFSCGFDGLVNKVSEKLDVFSNLPHVNRSQLGLEEGNFHVFNFDDSTGEFEFIVEGEGVDAIERIWLLLETSVEYVFTELPTAWYNHRFGWLNDMALNQSRILIDTIAFGMFCLKFYEDGSQQFQTINNWLGNLIKIIADTIITGTIPWSDFLDLIADIPELIEDILDLIEIFFNEKYDLIFYAILEKLCLDFKRLKFLKGMEPWKDDIRIYGNVGQLKEGEKAEISTSRGGYDSIIVNNDDYEIVVSSEYKMGDIGNGYKAMHLCQIVCDGTAEGRKSIKTRKYSSYCFSGGEIHRFFLLNEESPIDKSKTKETQEISKPKTQLNFIEKIQQKFTAIQGFKNVIFSLNKQMMEHPSLNIFI